MTRCAIRTRQPLATPLSAPRKACKDVAHAHHTAKAPANSPSSLFLAFVHLGSSWGERQECSSIAAGTQRLNTRPESGLESSSRYTANQEIHFDHAIGREHQWQSTIETLRGNGCDLGERTSGHVIRRRANTRRRIAPAFSGSHAATHRARCVSSFSSSCPVTTNLVVTDAFPPRSPGGRRSARGFFLAPGAEGRGGNTRSGGTARSSLLVGGTNGRRPEHRNPVIRPERCKESAAVVQDHNWCCGQRSTRRRNACDPGIVVRNAVQACTAFLIHHTNLEKRTQSPWGGCRPGRETTKT